MFSASQMHARGRVGVGLARALVRFSSPPSSAACKLALFDKAPRRIVMLAQYVGSSPINALATTLLPAPAPSLPRKSVNSYTSNRCVTPEPAWRTGGSCQEHVGASSNQCSCDMQRTLHADGRHCDAMLWCLLRPSASPAHPL